MSWAMIPPCTWQKVTADRRSDVHRRRQGKLSRNERAYHPHAGTYHHHERIGIAMLYVVPPLKAIIIYSPSKNQSYLIAVNTGISETSFLLPRAALPLPN